MNLNSMTPSQWLDVAVLAVAFIAAISGWRSGALGSLLSFVGVLLGAIAGVLLAPHLVSHIAAPRAKLFAALFLILALVVIGEVAGVVLGRAVRGAIRSRSIRTVDSVIGVGVQLVVVLTAAWLLATPLTQSKDQPELAAAVRGSRVLAKVNEVAPPWLKTVPKRLSALLNTSGLPAVLEPFSRTPVIPVASPDPELASNPVVQATAPSVVKVRSLAPSCQKVLEGSGFVIAPDRVMTNAHVVAGSNSVQIYASGNPLDATVVSYDPSVDIAILAVPNLPPPPLPFAQTEAKTGASVVVLGYPGGGNFTATPARIRELIKLSGPDIYRDPAPVTRDVYTIRASVEQGNSGGPLIDLNGQVLGVVFGAAVDDPDTGFVLTADEVAGQLARSARPRRWAPGPASVDGRAVHVLEEARQVPVDLLRRLFVAEMPCARDGYVAALRRVTPGPVDRVGQHVGVFLAAQVQQRHAELPAHRPEEPPSLVAQLAAHRPALVLQGAVRRRRDLNGRAQMADGLGKVFGRKPFRAAAAADQALDLRPAVAGQQPLGPQRHLVSQQCRQQRPGLVAARQRGLPQRRRVR